MGRRFGLIEHSPYRKKEPLGIVYMQQPSLLLRPVINITTFYTRGCRRVGIQFCWRWIAEYERHRRASSVRKTDSTRLDVVIYTDRDSSNKTLVKLGVDAVPSGDAGHSLGTKVTLRVLFHEVVLDSKQTRGPLTRVFDDACVNYVLKVNTNEPFPYQRRSYQSTVPS